MQVVYLFDIDGTLLLSGGAGSKAISRVFLNRYQVGGAMDTVKPGGKTDDMILQECAEAKLGRRLSRQELDEILISYLPYLEEELRTSEHFRLMPAVVGTLDFLCGEGLLLGITTGNIEKAAALKLARARLSHYFPFGGYGSDSALRSELVLAAMTQARKLHQQQIPSENFIVVGDTTRDIAAAKTNGCRSIAVSTGSNRPEELAAAKPTALFASLAELPDWHRRLSSRASQQ